MKVIVTGGFGDVGRLVLPALTPRHQVRVLDLNVRMAPAFQVEAISGSVTDPEIARDAVTEQDALLYLAMGRKQDWRGGPDWAASHFDVNVKGLYIMLAAAADAGIRRVVYLSSANVWEDYLERERRVGDPPPDAFEVYGLTKRLGEEVCEAVARERGLSVTALRAAAPMPDEAWATYRDSDPRKTIITTSASDFNRAVIAALDLDRPGFRAVTITGDHDQRVLSWATAKQLLGWEPLARRAP